MRSSTSSRPTTAASVTAATSPTWSPTTRRGQTRRSPAARRHHRVMTAASDTFVACVDVLADALDDHEATGEDLAARLYMSRYHFDRLISSVAGEPPRTFRRRILLERSAFRLLTTGRTILDIAVEAGYGSH